MNRDRVISVTSYAVMTMGMVLNAKTSFELSGVLLPIILLAGGVGAFFGLRNTSNPRKSLLRSLAWLLGILSLIPVAVSITTVAFTGSWLAVPSSLVGAAVLAGLAFFVHRQAMR